jgi:nitroreductase
LPLVALGTPALTACSPSAMTYADDVRSTWRKLDHSPGPPASAMRELVRYATLAPSSHNTQCWRFTVDSQRVTIRPDFARRCPSVDPDDHHLFVSLGCATENLVQAAAAVGLHADVAVDSASGTVSVSLAASPSVAASPLFAAITHRQCTRSVYDGRGVSRADLALLESAAQGRGHSLHLQTAPAQIERVLEFVIAGNTAQMNDAGFMNELQHWIRFNDADAVRTGDGLFSRASGNPAIPGWLGPAMMRLVFTAKGENDKYARELRSSAGLAIFVSDSSDREHWVDAGRAYQRFVLQATALGIKTAMVNQAVEVGAVRGAFRQAMGLDGRPDLVVRFGYAPEMPRSLRRPVAAVID